MAHYRGQLVPIDPNKDTDVCRTCNESAQFRLVEKVGFCKVDWSSYCTTHSEEAREAMLGTCDWCKGSNLITTPHRDFEEGSNGPVYEVCQACRVKESADLSEETGWDT
jgi:hypothetical protein